MAAKRIKHMNTVKSHTVTTLGRIVQIVAAVFLLAWFGFLLYTRQYSRLVFDLCCLASFAIGIPLFNFAVTRGYLKTRSQDSWGRIIAVTLFIIAAVFLLTVVVGSFLK